MIPLEHTAGTHQSVVMSAAMSARHFALQMGSSRFQSLSVGTFLGHDVALDFLPFLSYH